MKINHGESFVVPLSDLPTEAKAIDLIWLAPGTFLMGSPADEPGGDAEDGPQFEMTISQGFWLGRYAVTQAQWQVVMGNNPSHFQDQYPDGPVENVRWYQATAFCEQLTLRFREHLPAGYEFGLPTEAQWEYACRAGTQTLYHSGNSLADLARVAWYEENSAGYPHAVGKKEPNAWGLYDMHGNVAEWCSDSPSDYPDAAAVDWIGSGDGFVRNLRGGSWGTSIKSIAHHCACRIYVEPDVARPWIGFRLCLRPII
jgi:formylglycine-generating enzyme required for sulfatase activity